MSNLTTPSKLKVPAAPVGSHKSVTNTLGATKSTVFTPVKNGSPQLNIIAPLSARSTPKSLVSRIATTRELSPTKYEKQQHTVTQKNVKVVTRFRPFNKKELLSQAKRAVQIQAETNSISINMGKTNQATFTFDKVFEESTIQKDFHEYSIADTVEDLFEGFHGTVLCYGQTGSGKTYSLMGDVDNEEAKGIIPRICDQIFELITSGPSEIEYLVGVSYLEIYNEKLRDLLVESSGVELKIVEDKAIGVHVKNLSKFHVSGKEEVYDLMKKGNSQKVIAMTNMNEESSRSHSIFQISLKQTSTAGDTKLSTLHLVDLAGSERINKTGAVGETLEEAKKINSSLSSLGNVINALTDGKSTHIPYRGSKLTRILKEALGGNSRTTLIINCSPSFADAQETLAALRFGARAKNIKNNAHVNEEMNLTQMKLKLDQVTNEREKDKIIIERLRAELKDYENSGRVSREAGISSDESNSDITVVDDDNESSLMDLLSIRDREYEEMENSKDAELIQLKLRVAELVTTHETLMYDLRNQVEREVQLRSHNDVLAGCSNLPVDKNISKLEDELRLLIVRFSDVQNKNNDMIKTIKDLENLVRQKNIQLQQLEDVIESQSARLSYLDSSKSSYSGVPTNHFSLHPRPASVTSLTAKRGAKVGLNLRIMKPLKAEDTEN